MREFIKKNKVYILGIVLALILVVTITVTSYAYFTAGVNKETVNNTVVSTGSMEIEFTDGAQVSLDDAIPGQSVTKTFKVKNVGSLATNYDVYMSDLVNNFADKTDLVYTLTSNDGGYNVTTPTQVPSQPTKIVNNHLLGLNEEHNYTLTISFKETNDNQDDNLNKLFSTVIRINEYIEAKKITLNLNNNESNEEIYVLNGKKIGLLNNPTRDHYNFAGWYKEASFTNRVDENTIADDSLTNLYAKWVGEEYTVNIEIENGSVSSDSVTINYAGSSQVTITPDTDYALKTAECDNGYTIDATLGSETAQTITINNNDNVGGATCTLTLNKASCTVTQSTSHYYGTGYSSDDYYYTGTYKCNGTTGTIQSCTFTGTIDIDRKRFNNQTIYTSGCTSNYLNSARNNIGVDSASNVYSGNLPTQISCTCD